MSGHFSKISISSFPAPYPRLFIPYLSRDSFCILFYYFSPLQIHAGITSDNDCSRVLNAPSATTQWGDNNIYYIYIYIWVLIYVTFFWYK